MVNLMSSCIILPYFCRVLALQTRLKNKLLVMQSLILQRTILCIIDKDQWSVEVATVLGLLMHGAASPTLPHHRPFLYFKSRQVAMVMWYQGFQILLQEKPHTGTITGKQDHQLGVLCLRWMIIGIPPVEATLVPIYVEMDTIIIIMGLGVNRIVIEMLMYTNRGCLLGD